MEINEKDIVASYVLDDGNKYIFLANKTVYMKKTDGSLIKIELSKNNMQRINKEIGEGETDIVK